jgi:hypothetical protein
LSLNKAWTINSIKKVESGSIVQFFEITIPRRGVRNLNLDMPPREEKKKKKPIQLK